MSSNKKISVVVAGATGYVGLDLIYILSKHPKVKINYLCAQKNIGKKVNVITTEDKLISGELISSENDEITLKEVNTVKNTSTKKKEIIENIHLLKMKNIKETKLIISF